MPALPVAVPAARQQTDVGLVHQCAGLERVVAALSPHQGSRHVAQFRQHQAKQALFNTPVPGAPGVKQLRDLAPGFHGWLRAPAAF